ncbi:hypothetical protein [Streptomyces sp. NPDC004284]|uniref:hypothetical protein n=1 Tax=Streptomyces sp. NPDC004284 TaxID=3364695 RepID=UPI0036A2CF96
MITAVGHADLAPDTLRAVERELRVRLERLGGPVSGLVRAGSALSAAFGRAVRASGRGLVVLLPAQRAVPAPLASAGLEPAREVVALAEEVRLLTYDPDDRDACVGADEALIGQCSRIFAVWDGSPSNGRDATAHLVAYARARGVTVDVVWPVAAIREPARHGAGREGSAPSSRG